MFKKKTTDGDTTPVKRRPRTPKTSHLYIDKEEMMDELQHYKETEEITDKLGSMFLKLAIRYTSKPNLSGYTYRDDMIASAVSRMVEQIGKFNVDHPARNPFAYFTMLTYRQVITYIAKEHRYTGIKKSVRSKLWAEFGEDYDVDIDQVKENDRFMDYVADLPDTAENFVERVMGELEELKEEGFGEDSLSEEEVEEFEIQTEKELMIEVQEAFVQAVIDEELGQ
jgi:DNA-directed RNA polymerase specialized sigma24 family protein